MRELLDDIDRWRAEDKRVALATVVSVWGSAPRPLGSKMALTDGGDMAGSVSSGCVEGAVYEEAQAVLASGTPRLLEFGVSDETAWSVGLSCGGTIRVWVEPLEPPAEIHRALERRLAEERPAVLATVIAGSGVGNQLLLDLEADGALRSALGTLGTAARDHAVRAPARAALERLASTSITLGDEADDTASDAATEVFLDVHQPRRTLFAIGAVHVAIPLVVFARTLGMRTVVIDPRSAFATRARFPDADVVDTGWPDEALARHGLGLGSHVAALSHDLKIDVPALAAALRSPARYIGALGSRKTHAKRVAALREQGFDDDALARIHNPIGLPLGGRRAEEIAVSIIAEIVAVGHGRDAPAGRDG